MKVIVVGRAEAGQILNTQKDITHIVSIGHDAKSGKPPPGFKQYKAEKLRLVFHDVTWDRKHLVAPTKNDVKKLLKFFKKALLEDGDKKFLIHCQAGKSRSAAAALMLLYLNMKNADKAAKKLVEIRSIAKPNPLMVKFADEVLECNGDLIKIGKRIIKNRHKE